MLHHLSALKLTTVEFQRLLKAQILLYPPKCQVKPPFFNVGPEAQKEKL